MRPEPLTFDQPPPAGRPPRPYAPGRSVLTLSEHLPAAVQKHLAPFAGQWAEGGGFLYGVRGSAGDSDVVHAFVLPPQIRNTRNYRVPREGVAAASTATLERGWVLLGQLHTHPGANVEHSWFDDRNAISSKALSLVVPHYGADQSAWPAGIGVHEFQRDWWHLLDADQARSRVQFSDMPLEVLDLRT